MGRPEPWGTGSPGTSKQIVCASGARSPIPMAAQWADRRRSRTSPATIRASPIRSRTSAIEQPGRHPSRHPSHGQGDVQAKSRVPGQILGNGGGLGGRAADGGRDPTTGEQVPPQPGDGGQGHQLLELGSGWLLPHPCPSPTTTGARSSGQRSSSRRRASSPLRKGVWNSSRSIPKTYTPRPASRGRKAAEASPSRRMVSESRKLRTPKAMLAPTLARSWPGSTSGSGRWVATRRWMPAARPEWALTGRMPPPRAARALDLARDRGWAKRGAEPATTSRLSSAYSTRGGDTGHRWRWPRPGRGPRDRPRPADRPLPLRPPPGHRPRLHRRVEDGAHQGCHPGCRGRGDLGEQVPEVVGAASLPGRTGEGGGDGGDEARVGIGGDQADPREPSGDQASEEGEPSCPVLSRGHLAPEDLPMPVGVHARGNEHVHEDDPAFLADLDGQDIGPDEAVGALVQGPVAERCDEVVELLGHLGDLGPRPPRDPQGLGQAFQPPRRDPE